MDSFSINRVNQFTPKHMPDRRDEEGLEDKNPERVKKKPQDAVEDESEETSLPDHLGSNIDMRRKKMHGDPQDTQSVVPGRRIRVNDQAPRVIIPPSMEQKPPQLELIRKDDVVQAIQVTCTCGQCMRLDLEYESAGQKT